MKYRLVCVVCDFSTLTCLTKEQAKYFQQQPIHKHILRICSSNGLIEATQPEIV